MVFISLFWHCFGFLSVQFTLKCQSRDSGSFNSDIPHCSLKRQHSNHALWWRLHTNYLFSCILIPFVDSTLLFFIPCFIKLEFMCWTNILFKGSFVVILVVIFLITTQILHMLVSLSVSVWFSIPNRWWIDYDFWGFRLRPSGPFFRSAMVIQQYTRFGHKGCWLQKKTKYG